MKTDLLELVNILRNERAVDKLLKYNDKIDGALQIIKSHSTIECNSLKDSLISIELEQIMFLVKNYLFTRFNKMKKILNLDFILMSNSERIFYQQYLETLKDLNLSCETDHSKNVEYVGFICLKQIKEAKIDSEIIDIFEDDFFVARFSDVEEYLNEGKIMLL